MPYRNISKYKEWRLRNSERLKQYNKDYYLKNKKRLLKLSKEYNKIWQRKNKDKVAARARRYRNNLNCPERKEKDNVRRATLHKYGSPFVGYQYHHTTSPYQVDAWVMVERDVHDFIHGRCL